MNQDQKCRVCRETKLLSEYYKQKSCRNGHKYICKVCDYKRELKRCRNNYYRTKLKGSRANDKKKDIYDEDKHITVKQCYFLEEQQENRCYYCQCYMTKLMSNMTSTDATIERLDNNIGHQLSNCVLACWRCNNSRSNNWSSDDFKYMMDCMRHKYLFKPLISILKP